MSEAGPSKNGELFGDQNPRDEGARVRDFSGWPFAPMTCVRVDGYGSHWLGTFLRPTGSGMCEVAPLERSGVVEPTRFVRIALLSEET